MNFDLHKQADSILENAENFSLALKNNGELPGLIASAIINDDWHNVEDEIKMLAEEFHAEIEKDADEPEDLRAEDHRQRARDYNAEFGGAA